MQFNPRYDLNIFMYCCRILFAWWNLYTKSYKGYYCARNAHNTDILTVQALKLWVLWMYPFSQVFTFGLRRSKHFIISFQSPSTEWTGHEASITSSTHQYFCKTLMNNLKMCGKFVSTLFAIKELNSRFEYFLYDYNASSAVSYNFKNSNAISPEIIACLMSCIWLVTLFRLQGSNVLRLPGCH